MSADLALVLSVAAVVIVDKVMRSTAQRADNIFRNGFTIPALDWLDGFAVSPQIVFEEKLPVLFDKGPDAREFVNLKLLILWRVGIVIGPLLEWYISTDKGDQPAVLLVKMLNNR